MARKINLALCTACLLLPMTVSLSAPAHATSTSTKPLPAIGSEDQKEVLERERVRRHQVRQNQSNGLFEPIFAPLYEGYNSPTQKVKRVFE